MTGRPRRAIRAIAMAAAVGVVAGAPGDTAAEITRAPYLQSGTHSAVTVVWRTATAEPSVVCYGAAPDALTRTASTGTTATHHEVRLTGLDPNTQYFYAAAQTACPPAAAGDPKDYVLTAPVPGTRAPFRAWVVGDSGTGGSRQAQVRDVMLGAAVERRPNVFVHVGDMAYNDGTTAEFDDHFYVPYREVLRNTVCWPALGNHEGHSADSGTQSGPYYDGYALPGDGSAGGVPSGTEAYYAFDYANVHFVVLDSHDSPRELGGAMLQWLAEDLASTDQEWLVAYWHHPPYTKGSHDSDTEGQLVDMRENVLPILEASGVDLVLAGHSHIYERSYLVSGAFDTPTTAAGHIVDPGDGRTDGDGAYVSNGRGAVYVVAGHGGAGVRGAGDHPLMYVSELANGSCLLDVAGPALTLTNLRYDGVETDRVTLVKRDGLYVLSPVGGEEYLAGAVIDIEWGTAGGASPSVSLEYSLDAGATWTTIVDATDNDGHHAWTAPRRVTTAGQVRVTNTTNADDQATSPGLFALVTAAREVVIPWGAVWEYHDDGTDPGPSWATEYGGWPSGPAQLGYSNGEEDDEATVVLDEDPNIPSVFVRHRLTLTGPPAEAELALLFDDGAAVFVNGVQVAAANVDDLAFDAYASDASSDNQRLSTTIELSEIGAPFVAGDNIVAAVVKQANGSSSDLSFDLELILRVTTEVDPDQVPEIDAGSPPEPPLIQDDDTAGCACETGGAGGGHGAVVLVVLVGLALRSSRRLRRSTVPIA